MQVKKMVCGFFLLNILDANAEDGVDGKDGDVVEFRFAKSGSPTLPPALNVTLNPAGWSLLPVTINWRFVDE